ncbi:RES domain-containing protein [Asticcacaulis sp. EMRT-3]|uniref:RES family NAD+ phosphorylase n=1 Tax=Asticcacaulis sp. EMRT-3 TaxID=3040349 RepID=UPI0024AEEDE7|nr:RES domain-containing protein [Asticcacaulis sp. EMRT-3]MDI7776595.1 RES domain-containing protein [Asticcacaulis sp. EMRT-3]
MTAQILDRQLISYRVGDANGKFPIYDATGARLYPGRWNTPSSPIIYSAANYATTLLEKLVHGGGILPDDQHYIEITIPPGVSYERFDTKKYPGWDGYDETICKTYGAAWYIQKRSVILLVKSAVTKIDDNILINPDHPEFKMLTPSLHEPVYWDGRLFAPSAASPKARVLKPKAKP